jgi:hypothetical protein
MSVKTLGITNKVILGLCLAVMLFSNLVIAQDFELTYLDPEGDVKDFEDHIYEEGYEHIDILEISSSESTLGAHLILEMTVNGLITDSDQISYGFSLMDSDVSIYEITYKNGVCLGEDTNEGNTDILQASGGGTSTLEIRVQKSNLGEISDFDFIGGATEFNEATEQFFLDMVPDSSIFPDDDFDNYEMPLMITEPKPGATVSGTKTITGIIDTFYEMISVEIQFDSESEGGWILTSTTNNWESWSYEWQSTNLPDGEHIINARAYDGSEYYYDSIIVHVDQSNAISPRTSNVPTLKIGSELRYTMDYSDLYDYLYIEDFDMTMEMSAEMTMKVSKKENIEVNSKRFEAYHIDMTVSMTMIMSYEGESSTTTLTGKGTEWVRVSDLATIKGIMETEATSSIFGMTTTSTDKSTITYDPPMDDYNFPMSIAETWTSACTTTTEYTYTYDGESDSETESIEVTMVYEALHVDDITVPAGTFETFVIWSMDTSEDYGGGEVTPFFGSSPGYTLNYYSPDIGFPVKSDYYAPNRELYMSMELISYKEAKSDNNPSINAFGWEIPIYFLLIPVLVAIILASVIAVRRRRKKFPALESWDQYAVRSEIPAQPFASRSQVYQSQTRQVYTAQPSQLTAYSSRAYPTQTRQVYTAQTTPPKPPPKVQQVGYSQRPSRAYVPPPPPSTVRQPGVYPIQTSKPNPPPPPPPKAQQPSYYPQQRYQPSQPVTPMIQIRCPRCANSFSVSRGITTVQCPRCGVRGKMQL